MPFLEGIRKLFGGRQEIRMPRRWPRIVMTETSMMTLPDNRREPVKITNLSAGGARIRASFPVPAHERVMLQLPFGAGSRPNLAAHVVYCQRDQHGLHYVWGLSFVGADRDGIPEILAYIEDEQHRRSGTRDAWRR